MSQSNRKPHKQVYLLWHTDKHGDEKLLGVYATEKKATSAIGRIKGKPGFSGPGGEFEIAKYEVDKDYWIEGFARRDGFSLPAWFHPPDSKE
ncbi:MAG TPA: hypothetical protein VMS96_10600 [Terriglobales bacterium]|nr:hypothetical protein [Terriglobales bacterium]